MKRGQWMIVVTLFLVAASVGAQDSAKAPDTPDVDALIAVAGRALHENRLDAAETGFEAARAAAPDRTMPVLGLSVVRERQGRWIEALTLARAAATMAPQSPSVFLTIGRLQARLDRPTAALEAFARVRTLDAGLTDAYILAALVLRDQGRYEEGIDLLRLAEAVPINAPSIGEELGLLLLAADRPGEAWAVAEDALVTYPHRPRSKMIMGLAAAADPERSDEGRRWLKASLEDDATALAPGDLGRIHLALGGLTLEQGDSNAGLDHLRTAASLLPQDPQVHYHLGNALRQAGDETGAQAALEQFQTLRRGIDQREAAGKAVGTALNAAQSLANDGQLQEALASVDALLAEHPHAARAHTLRGKVLFSMNRRDEALAAVTLARERMPHRVENHYLEGLFASQAGRLPVAEAALGRAVALDAAFGDGHALLGMVIAEQGRLEESLEHFAAALANGAESKALRFAWAKALQALGRSAESEAQVQAADRLGKE